MKKLIFLLFLALMLIPVSGWGAAATMYVTPAGAGAKDGTSWATAFGEAEFEADLEANAEAGDIYYVLAGTYTLDSSYDASGRNGTAVGPISIIGVKAATSAEPPTYSDWGTGTDRPTFACENNAITTGNYYKLINLIITKTSAGYALTTGTVGLLFNSKISNTSGSAMQSGAGGKVINNEFTSSAYGIYGSSGLYYLNYIHDCANGFLASAGSSYLISNVFDTITGTGIDQADNNYGGAINNTLYNCATGVAGGTGTYITINNIVDTVTDGFKWTTATNSNFHWNNHMGSSVTDMYDGVEESVTAHKDNAVTGGAGTSCSFTNAAGGDFSFAKTGACVDTGIALTLGTATAGKRNQGAYDMTQNPASGGGGAWGF